MSFRMILSDQAKYSMTRSDKPSVCDSWASCSLRYGDLSICNMAAVCHIEFSKFRVYVTWPLSPCYSAFLCDISLKSYYQTIGCWVWPKNYFNMAAARHLEFEKMFIFGHLAVIEFQMCCCVPNIIRIRWFTVEIWRFHIIFKMADIRYIEFGSNNVFVEKPM